MRNEPLHTAGAVVVLNADAPTGHRIVHDLLDAGNQVVVSGRHAAQLIPMLHGYSADRVAAIAADSTDPRQLHRLLRRAADRFGSIAKVVDAATDDREPPLRLAS